MIDDYNIYDQRMARGIEEKAFFLNKINMESITHILDFGCADGQLIKFLKYNCSSNKHIKYVGYDTDPKQISRAKEYLKNEDNITLLDNWEKVVEYFKQEGISSRILVVMSSVIHEIGSYCSKQEAAKTFYNIIKLDPCYIAIRDMLPWKSSHYWNRTVCNSFEDYHPEFSNLIADFKKANGIYELNKMSDIVHFLLKKDYKENWEREVKENYFSYGLKDILSIFSSLNLIYLKSYTPPFIEDMLNKYCVFKTFNTHAQIIFEKC